MPLLKRTPEDTPRVLLLALVLWAAGATLLAFSDGFVHLGTRLVTGVGAFATVFAVATGWFDRGVRRELGHVDARVLWLAAALGVLAIATAFARDWTPATPAGAVIVLFAIPVTITVAVTLLLRGVMMMRGPAGTATAKARGDHVAA